MGTIDLWDLILFSVLVLLTLVATVSTALSWHGQGAAHRAAALLDLIAVYLALAAVVALKLTGGGWTAWLVLFGGALALQLWAWWLRRTSRWEAP
jgi:hypothetical protein